MSTDKRSILEFFGLDRLSDIVMGYIKTQMEIYKLQIQEELVASLAKITILALQLGVGLAIMLFANLAMGFYLNEVIGSTYLGFVLVTGFYVLLFLIILVLRKRIVRTFLQSIIIKPVKEEEEADV